VLNQNQNRRLTIRLSRMLAEARELLEDVDRSGERSAVPCDDLRAELTRLIEGVQEAARTLGLDLRQVDVKFEQRVRIWSALWRARILDCRPATLRGLGPVGDVAARTLEPTVEGLAAVLKRIEALVPAPATPPENDVD